ncbi:hypothetical protein ACN42_g11762 [Penicillium freii]|uniref:Enoyl reductase (ER) domain-containing protein n=1 Tax=Penicillium freii TaxID=48697 RepID=A0A101M7T5_PENFR|nr:hypothetical protein ACN42_g11762 [Penicillium freii]
MRNTTSSFGVVLKLNSNVPKSLDELVTISATSATGEKLEMSSLPSDKKVELGSGSVLIVEETAQESFNDALAQYLSTETGLVVKRVLLQDLTASIITPKSLLISTIELTRPVLSTLTGEEMQYVKLITDNAHSLLWLTGGGNMEGACPDFALMSGLSRALILEQPSLQITMLDLDIVEPSSQTLQNISAVLRESVKSMSPDFEYTQRKGLLHISRMLPEEEMNRAFRDKQGQVLALTPASETSPARLTIGTVVFSTALYALHHHAYTKEGESILIHSAAGSLGNTTIQIAQLAKAEIYTTVSTEEKKDYLVKAFNLKREHIFHSRDSSFQQGILAATRGRGVDIVLNSLTGDLLHNSWRDIVDTGKLDIEMFRRNVTFSAFGLSELSNEDQLKLNRIAASLLAETLSLYQQKKIRSIEPLKVFDVSEITPNKTQDLPYDWLGHSISKWMVKRGARKFVFVGRTGTDRKPARQLVEDLEAEGADITVVRGDVGVLADVQKAVAAIKGPVGGVI